MKTVLMMGGSTVQLCAIRKAREMGCRVVVCDYLPDNPGQYEADKFYQVSTTDKEAVLEVAKKEQADGVVCYATDVAAPTTAYVCEQLGLPTHPYQSVVTLSNKDLFRSYLHAHGFHAPKSACYTDAEALLRDADGFSYPVMVKPVDSSGSKGVNKVMDKAGLAAAFADAWQYTRAKRVIVEEFIEKVGYQISGDGFSVDGKLVFRCFGNEYYGGGEIKDYVPLGECWPSVLPVATQQKVHDEIQRLITSLGMRTGAYNIEAVLDKNENVYILELGARSGGSMIPQITQYATGVDTVEYVIRAALGMDCSNLKMVEPTGFWSNYNVLSLRSGRLKQVEVDQVLKDCLMEYQTSHNPGDPVEAFVNGGHALGVMVFRYRSMEEMLKLVARMPELVRVELE